MNREAIEMLYREYCETPSAINEHLPTLRMLASEVNYCVEFGVKWGRSTTALLLGCKCNVISYDIEETPQANELLKLAGYQWEYNIFDSRTAGLPFTDLLFVDSLHTYKQVKAEIQYANEWVKKTIIFHDIITFGSQGADGETGKVAPGVMGIMPTILEFLRDNHQWYVRMVHHNNNGLLVLQRE